PSFTSCRESLLDRNRSRMVLSNLHLRLNMSSQRQFQPVGLHGSRYLRTLHKYGVLEIEDLLPVYGRKAGGEDQHVAGAKNFIAACLTRWSWQRHTLVRCEQWASECMQRLVDVL